jgi:hypothetical protein
MNRKNAKRTPFRRRAQEKSPNRPPIPSKFEALVLIVQKRHFKYLINKTSFPFSL